MKQFIAILLFSLMCCTTVIQSIGAYESSSEQLVEAKENSKDLKEQKKETKEFIKLCTRPGSFFISALNKYFSHAPSSLSHPVMDKHTPPPDGIC